MDVKPRTYFHLELPNGERYYTSGFKPRNHMNLRFALEQAQNLPPTSKVWWGNTKHKFGKPFDGYMVEVVMKHKLCLYEINGLTFTAIKPEAIRKVFA